MDKEKYLLPSLAKSSYRAVMTDLSKMDGRYIGVIYDIDQFSIIVTESEWINNLAKKYPTKNIYGPIGIIRCRKENAPSGYLLELVSVLSPEGISVCVETPYTGDNIFVDYPDLEKAFNLLQELKIKYRKDK
jgi:hypothetical protein